MDFALKSGDFVISTERVVGQNILYSHEKQETGCAQVISN